MKSDIKPKLPKVQTYWHEYQSGVVAAAEPYRFICGLLALIIVLCFAIPNGSDYSGLLASRDTAFTMLCLILPIAIVFFVDIDLIDLALKTVGDFFVLGENTPNEVPVAKLKKYHSVTHAVPLSPPRFNLV